MEGMRDERERLPEPWNAPAGTEPGMLTQTAQLAQGIARMMALIRQMEERMAADAARITISHDQAKGLLLRIRQRANALCERHHLDGAGDAAFFRAQIKKAVLQRNGIRDLHDLPLRSLDAEGRWIDTFTDYKLVMKRREAHGRAD